MTRRQAREQAFALIFEKSFNEDVEMQDIIALAHEERLIEVNGFASKLAIGAWEHIEDIDALVEDNAIAWKKSRISKVTLAVLRLALYELVFCKEIPVGVSINEAVELCKIYGDDEDASFVNGILGSVSRTHDFEKDDNVVAEE